MKTLLIILSIILPAIASDSCHKYLRGHLTGRWIDLYRHYPPDEWQKDVLIRNSGNPNWWTAEFSIIHDDSIKIESNFQLGWEYLVVLTRSDCEEK